ncbi:MAG: nickel pincer cofactor biosynthesis protein LarB [Nitrososphaerales archaeon]
MEVKDVLEKLASGKISVREARRLLSLHTIEYVEDMAKLDIGRDARKGIPEVIYAESKTYADLRKIADAALRRRGSVIISRIDGKQVKQLQRFLRRRRAKVVVSERARALVASKKEKKMASTGGRVGIITAGTSDIPVAEEARLMVEAMGCRAITSYDVGIAGMHRLFPALKLVLSNNVDAIIVVAGMEGALASVVTTLVDVPVVGVPTSVGYGFGSEGFAALASMLQSCTFGLAVMNIDNGIGAGALAATIANRTASARHNK